MSRLRVELAEGNADDQLVLLSWNSKIRYSNYMKNHMILAASGIFDLIYQKGYIL